MPQLVCRDDDTAADPAAVGDGEVERDRAGSPASVNSPSTLSRPPSACTEVERNADLPPQQNLFADRLVDARLVLVAERLHPPSAVTDTERGGVGIEHDARGRPRPRGSPPSR